MVEAANVFVEHLLCVRVLSSLRRRPFMALETRSTPQKQSVLNRYCRYLFKPSPKSQVFQLALAIDHLIQKNPVVQVLINSSLVLVEYAPLLPACQCMLSTFAILQVCKFNLHQTAL